MARRKQGRWVVMVALLSSLAFADELKKVNESCEQVPCESGLFCVDTRDGKKCATCEQGKLNDYREQIDQACKTIGQGWTPDNSALYKSVVAEDGRVLVDIFDPLLEVGKQCRPLRQEREGTCWGGGDPGHQTQIEDVGRSIQNVADTKKDLIYNLRVYYGTRSDYSGSKSEYESYLRISSSKCSSDINVDEALRKLSSVESDLGRSTAVDRSDLEKVGDAAERCVNASKDLLRYGFQDSSSKFPRAYADKLSTAQTLMGMARDLNHKAKDQSLCK